MIFLGRGRRFLNDLIINTFFVAGLLKKQHKTYLVAPLWNGSQIPLCKCSPCPHAGIQRKKLPFPKLIKVVNYATQLHPHTHCNCTTRRNSVRIITQLIPAPFCANTLLCCKKALNIAHPVPGPTIIKGVAGCGCVVPLAFTHMGTWLIS